MPLHFILMHKGTMVANRRCTGSEGKFLPDSRFSSNLKWTLNLPSNVFRGLYCIIIQSRQIRLQFVELMGHLMTSCCLTWGIRHRFFCFFVGVIIPSTMISISWKTFMIWWYCAVLLSFLCCCDRTVTCLIIINLSRSLIIYHLCHHIMNKLLLYISFTLWIP